MTHGRQRWLQLASYGLILVLWLVVAELTGSRLLPGPYAVAEKLGEEFGSGDLMLHLGATLGRVAASFVLAMAVGCAIGIAMGRNRSVDRLLDGWLILFLNIPALVIIILAYVWFGLTEAAAVGAVAINKIPNVVVTMREGARALNRDLLEMAGVFRMNRWRKLRHVVVPQLSPYLMASTRSGLSLIWKIVLVVELLGRGNGVGFQLQMFFSLFDIAGILAYTVAFVAVVLAIELLLLQPLEKRITRWRR
ncbi:MAG: ABC transporter permease [Alphaproteobacteria bacterium]|nr:ABC transporter permease [Alphaproteobacteria bacterium]